MRIKFLIAYTVKSVGGLTYEAGSVHDLPDSSAAHFLRRGIAVLATADKVQTAEPNPEPHTEAVVIPEEREIASPDINLNAPFEAIREKEIGRPAKRGKRKHTE